MEKVILTIIGARPQFIKAAVVSRGMAAWNKGSTRKYREIIVHSGQHYDKDMSEVFFQEMEIRRPDHYLGVVAKNHGAMTGRMLEKIEQVILKERPNVVLVYGDTNTTLAGALAAAKLQVPVGHVEAGLRSFNRGMPEEINRILTDHISTFLFAPTTTAVENLRREGINSEKTFLVGDVMYTAALYYGDKAEAQSRIIEQLSLRPGEYLLVTIHRAENTDDPQRLRAIFEGLSQVAREMPVVLPLHPRTREALKQAQVPAAGIRGLSIIKPVGYLDMIRLEKHARLIITDSGGVQKEAFFHRVPCVTLRDETEWVELVDLGWNTLVSPESGPAVAAGIRRGLEAGWGREEMVYGDGSASEKILHTILGE